MSHDPASSEHAERARLVAEMTQLQEAMETTAMPSVTAQLLTIPLTMQQLKVLAILVTETDGNTVHGLATTLGVSVATMSGILDRLTSQGMATRTQDPDDQRVRRIVATPGGRETVKRLLAAQPQIDRAPLERMTVEDLRMLTRGIAALVRAMESVAADRAPGAEGDSDPTGLSSS